MSFEEDTSVEKVVLGLTLVLNAGLALGSLALAMSFMLTDREVSNLSILHPAIGYTLSAIIILISLKKSSINYEIFHSTRDSIPLLAFSIAVYQSGVRENWILFQLSFSIVLTCITIYFNKKKL
jgi:lipoprotein signal peptidase